MSKKVYIGGILPTSLTNGEGARFVVFFSGCAHKCKGCQNEHIQSLESGELFDIEDVFEMIKNEMPFIKGVTLSGGDPFYQAEEASMVAEFARENGLNVWTYTGYTLEEVIDISEHNESYKKLLKYTDVIVDGKFIEELKDENLEYRGSSNQNIIYAF